MSTVGFILPGSEKYNVTWDDRILIKCAIMVSYLFFIIAMLTQSAVVADNGLNQTGSKLELYASYY